MAIGGKSFPFPWENKKENKGRIRLTRKMKDSLNMLGKFNLNKDIEMFGSYLSGRLSFFEVRTITPMEFVRFAKASVHNLAHGFHYNGREPVTIFGRLAGNPDFKYSTLWEKIPEIVNVVFPVDFSKEVEKIVGL